MYSSAEQELTRKSSRGRGGMATVVEQSGQEHGRWEMARIREGMESCGCRGTEGWKDREKRSCRPGSFEFKRAAEPGGTRLSDTSHKQSWTVLLSRAEEFPHPGPHGNWCQSEWLTLTALDPRCC